MARHGVKKHTILVKKYCTYFLTIYHFIIYHFVIYHLYVLSPKMVEPIRTMLEPHSIAIL